MNRKKEFVIKQAEKFWKERFEQEDLQSDLNIWMALILAGGLFLIASHARGAEVHIGAEVAAIEDVNPAAYCEQYQCDEIIIEQENEQGEVFDVPYIVVVME